MSRPLTRMVGEERKPRVRAFSSESTSVLVSRYVRPREAVLPIRRCVKAVGREASASGSLRFVRTLHDDVCHRVPGIVDADEQQSERHTPEYEQRERGRRAQE